MKDKSNNCRSPQDGEGSPVTIPSEQVGLSSSLREVTEAGSPFETRFYFTNDFFHPLSRASHSAAATRRRVRHRDTDDAAVEGKTRDRGCRQRLRFSAPIRGNRGRGYHQLLRLTGRCSGSASRCLRWDRLSEQHRSGCRLRRGLARTLRLRPVAAGHLCQGRRPEQRCGPLEPSPGRESPRPRIRRPQTGSSQ